MHAILERDRCLHQTLCGWNQ